MESQRKPYILHPKENEMDCWVASGFRDVFYGV